MHLHSIMRKEITPLFCNLLPLLLLNCVILLGSDLIAHPTAISHIFEHSLNKCSSVLWALGGAVELKHHIQLNGASL